jgi:2-oxoglutarate ferredoxin oxidoreductase subunit delta
MKKVKFNYDACKGCGLCIDACPKKIIVMKKDIINSKGFNPAGVTDEDKCISCGNCAVICPDCVIEVYK